MTQKAWVYTGSIKLGGVTIYLIINRQIKKAMIKNIYDEIEGSTGKREEARVENILNGKMSAKISDAFNPLFYRTLAKGRGNPISKDVAIAKANQINNAWGVLGDNEEQIYGALRALPSKAAVSFVAFWYNKNHKSDLYSDINYKLSDDEKKIAFEIVEKLRSI